MKKRISFEENGDEYTGYLVITCDTFEKIDENTISINGATVTIDERIIDIVDLNE